jgi:exopolysaccharide biosynthesis predicted pyruvyltransferase EpsI
MNIYDYLNTYSHDLVYYCPNPGNGGDALIAYSTYQIFNEIGIKYKIARLGDNLKNKIVIYGGGGQLVNLYDSYGLRFIRRYHNVAKKLIILPHTISINKKYIEKFNQNIDIICRELTSYNYVKQINTKANVYLMNDMAFDINVNKLFYDGSRITNKLHLDAHYILQWVRFNYKRLITQFNSTELSQTLNSIRTDYEKTNLKLLINNFDISSKFGASTFTPKTALMITYQLLKYINKFEVINTNRLHMGIGGALLGKQVNFYPNSYWKNEAVYNYSLKEQYPNVKWMG